MASVEHASAIHLLELLQFANLLGLGCDLWGNRGSDIKEKCVCCEIYDGNHKKVMNLFKTRI